MSIRDNKAIVGMFLIGLASILWGFDGVVLTPRLHNLDVIFVVFILHVIPFILMNFFLYPRYKGLSKLDRKDIYALFIVSLFGGALGTIAIVKALFLVNFQQLSVVVLLQKFQPVFVIILVALFFKEKLTKHFIVWASIAIVAGYFLTFGLTLPNFTADNTTIKAMLLSLFAAFSFGSSTVFSKRILNKIDFITATFLRYGLTSLLLFPVIVLSGQIGAFQSVTNDNWFIIAIISITTGSGAILLYYYGLRYIKASVSTIVELFFPISAILFDYFINDNVLSLVQWLSAAIMIFAIIKANTQKRK